MITRYDQFLHTRRKQSYQDGLGGMVTMLIILVVIAGFVL